MDISGKPELSGNVLSDGISPPVRYLSASVFLPTKLYDIKHSFGYRSLYDEKIQSNQVDSDIDDIYLMSIFYSYPVLTSINV